MDYILGSWVWWVLERLGECVVVRGVDCVLSLFISVLYGNWC